MDKQAKFKIIGFLIILTLLYSIFVFSLGTTLESPADNFIDNDGYLDLRGSCNSAGSYDGTTSYNITNATLYSNVGGTWKENKTIHVVIAPNQTYYFNFTNTINLSNNILDEAEGTYRWNILCWERNATGTQINSVFGNNRSITIAYAEPTVSVTPADGYYSYNGHEIAGSCTVSPSTAWNVTNISLMTNLDGTWKVNQTSNISTQIQGDILYNFTINKYGNNSIADGTDIKFGCRVQQQLNSSTTGEEDNYVITEYTTLNRTINIEYPPIMTLNAPANSGWSNKSSDIFNFTATSAFTTGTNFYCQFKTNETGTWGVTTGSFNVQNNTPYTFNYGLAEKSQTSWGIYCQEGADANVYNWSINRTLKIDRTLPTLSINFIQNKTAVNNSYTNSKDDILINYTLTDANPSQCLFSINGTLNHTDSTYKFTTLNASDGIYLFNVECTDSATNRVNSSTFWMTVDTVAPAISGINNYTISRFSGRKLINISANEPMNATVFYGTTVNTLSHQDNSTYQTIQNITISGFEQNTVYYFNFTACDRAGNCNKSGESFGQFGYTYPWKLLKGWSYYGIYDAKINFSVILNQTEAEYVYYFNQTGQSWIYATAGGTADMGFEVGTKVGERANGGRHVVAIYEDTNSTWDKGTIGKIDRNTTNSGTYLYNFSTGDNLIKLARDVSFGNLSLTLFNSSLQSGLSGYEFGVTISQTPGNLTDNTQKNGGLVYNITDFWFSAYNNSGVTWEPYYVYNFTLDNSTILTPISVHEVVWIYSPYNLTWNTSNIIGNWSY